MIAFNSFTYYFFIAFAVMIFISIQNKDYKKYGLMLINVLFIGLLFYFRKKHIIILFTFILFHYGLLNLVHRIKFKRTLFIFQLVSSLLALCFFKYGTFQNPILSVVPQLGVLLKPLVFIGISFFTFRLISVQIDHFQEGMKEKLDFVHFTNFLLFFPCFLSGPLDRYDNFVQNFNEHRKLDAKDYYEIIYRITWGVFKKVVIADSLYNLSLHSIHSSEVMTVPVPNIILSAYIYSFVIYFDFSGYCDVAISVGRLFGITVPENFNNPYLARNMAEFWNRWHISLMHWLRDYIYFPIQKLLIFLGVTNYTFIACFAFMFVFIAAGVWHGDTMNYFYYGISHGTAFTIYLVYQKTLTHFLTKDQMKRYKANVPIRVIANVITYNYFVFSLFFYMDKYRFFGRLFN